MLQAITHIAVALNDVATAEALYRELFEMDVFARESNTGSGWKTLDPGIDWARAHELGLSVDLTILRNGPVVVAIERSEDGQIRVPDHIGLRLDPAMLDAVRARARQRGLTVKSDAPRALVLSDPFGLTWELQTSDEMRTSRDLGRGWIDAEGRVHEA